MICSSGDGPVHSPRARGPPLFFSAGQAYEISKSMDFWIRNGFLDSGRGFLDFAWISGFHLDFWISPWISGFRRGFLDLAVDFLDF